MITFDLANRSNGEKKINTIEQLLPAKRKRAQVHTFRSTKGSISSEKSAVLNCKIIMIVSFSEFNEPLINAGLWKIKQNADGMKKKKKYRTETPNLNFLQIVIL